MVFNDPFDIGADSDGFYASIKNDDVFLVAYPKSGTHWVAFFLSCILWREGDKTEPLSLANFRSIVGDANPVYRRRAIDFEGYFDFRRIMTLHAKYDARLPRVIYLVRDPRDVMVSYYHHHRRRDRGFTESLEEFVKFNRVPPWRGDWGDHVSGWNEHSAEQHILLVRYEDLQHNPTKWFGAIVDHVGLHVSPLELQDAIAQSSFQNMQRLELKYGMSSTPVNGRDLPFVRRGQVGGWCDELSREASDLIFRRYEDLLRPLRYS